MEQFGDNIVWKESVGSETQSLFENIDDGSAHMPRNALAQMRHNDWIWTFVWVNIFLRSLKTVLFYFKLIIKKNHALYSYWESTKLWINKIKKKLLYNKQLWGCQGSATRFSFRPFFLPFFSGFIYYWITLFKCVFRWISVVCY